MNRGIALLIAVAGTTLALANTGSAAVPAPPVNQTIGMDDVAIVSATEADCRACHDSGVPDRHHLLYPTYTCLDCHGGTFTVQRNCIVCHTASAHHTTAAAQSGDCVSCHGDIVDNMGDGHYIPTYSPSLVTPYRSEGEGLPLNSRGNGAGACDYCHDDDGLSTPVILTNQQLHHGTGFGSDATKCVWCHNGFISPFEEQIRWCEGCHGPDSLHNIQADSPKAPTGTIVVGGEDAGYGHVGRDAGPGDSDCWGCHGFAFASAPGSGPLIPTVFSADLAAVNAGTDTMVVLSGAAFTNLAGSTLFESDVALTAADGSSVTLTPDLLDQELLAVTIPGDTPPGNYNLQAVKADFKSNPVSISIVPEVTITNAVSDGTVTISGSGFGGYAEGSGTFVSATVASKGKGRRKKSTTTTEIATIVSWSDTEIVASFASSPEEVTVYSVFGDATSEVKVLHTLSPDPPDVGSGGGNRNDKNRGESRGKRRRK